jgi:predicted transcriptional regulator
VKVSDIVEPLKLRLLTEGVSLERTVSAGYAGDLLSDVLGHAEDGSVWLTVQVHKNVIGVAVMKECAAVIICAGRDVSDDVISKAEEEDVPLFSSQKTAFDLVGRLYELGIRGGSD